MRRRRVVRVEQQAKGSTGCKSSGVHCAATSLLLGAQFRTGAKAGTAGTHCLGAKKRHTAALTIAPRSSSGCPCTSAGGTWDGGGGAEAATRTVDAARAVSERCSVSIRSASCTPSTASRHASCAIFTSARKTLVGCALRTPRTGRDETLGHGAALLREAPDAWPGSTGAMARGARGTRLHCSRTADGRLLAERR